MNSFPPNVRKKIKFYVYLYTDPRNNEVFYIGKGKGNRCFAHLKSKATSDKVERISELRKLGLSPNIELLKYGLTESEALLVEQTAIDLLNVENLTNQSRGHGSRHASRASVEQVVAALDAKEVVIREPVILINISRLFRYGMSEFELYEATRIAWAVGPKRERATYAFSVYKSVVREVYKIQAWLPGNSTLRLNRKMTEGDKDRWEFVGKIAPENIRKKYVGKSVAKYQKPGAQNPIKYVNCN